MVRWAARTWTWGRVSGPAPALDAGLGVFEAQFAGRGPEPAFQLGPALRREGQAQVGHDDATQPGQQGRRKGRRRRKGRPRRRGWGGRVMARPPSAPPGPARPGPRAATPGRRSGSTRPRASGPRGRPATRAGSARPRSPTLPGTRSRRPGPRAGPRRATRPGRSRGGRWGRPPGRAARTGGGRLRTGTTRPWTLITPRTPGGAFGSGVISTARTIRSTASSGSSRCSSRVNTSMCLTPLIRLPPPVARRPVGALRRRGNYINLSR